MTPRYADDWLTVYQGDCREVLPTLPEASVDCVVTSPPYWSLRNYEIPPSVWGGEAAHVHEWESQTKSSGGIYLGKDRWQHQHNGRAERQDGDRRQRLFRIDGHPEVPAGALCPCGAWFGALGLEPTPELFVEHLVEVMRHVRRVLRPDGTVWLNLGDCYATRAQGPNQTHGSSDGGTGRSSRPSPRSRIGGGIKNKDLVGIPWMAAFALRADGWYLRMDVVWSKPNPMPESATDRPTRAHEYVFLLSRSERYYYDAAAIAEPVSPNTHARIAQHVASQAGSARANGGSRPERPMKAVAAADPRLAGGLLLGGDRYSGFNERWAESGLRTPKTTDPGTGVKNNRSMAAAIAGPVLTRNRRSVWSIPVAPYSDAHFATFPPALVEPCVLAGVRPGGVVLDPFGGTGTVGMVAQRLSRRSVLIELNPDYIDQQMRRNSQAPLGLGASEVPA